MDTKTCSKCGETKARSEFHKHKASKDGLCPRCKVCRCLEEKARNERNNPERVAETARRKAIRDAGNRQCFDCKKVLPATREFFHGGGKAMGLSCRCKECTKPISSAKSKKRWAENKESQSANYRKWRLKNQHIRTAKRRAERARDPQKFRDKEACYRSRNPEYGKAKENRRRAKQVKASGFFTDEQWQARLDYHGNSCAYCNSTEDLTIDHMIPLSRGGSQWASNLVPACRSCNSTKGDKTPIEFADYTFKQLQAMLGK